MVATYESASTRRYKLGRVDCIRSTTMEALEWVRSMQTDESVEEKVKKFHAAVEKQTTIMVENILGEGIDIHLLGLRQQASELGIPIPKLFEDETFAIANHFALSTSQVTRLYTLFSKGSEPNDNITLVNLVLMMFCNSFPRDWISLWDMEQLFLMGMGRRTIHGQGRLYSASRRLEVAPKLLHRTFATLWDAAWME